MIGHTFCVEMKVESVCLQACGQDQCQVVLVSRAYFKFCMQIFLFAGSVATVEQTSYTVPEDIGTADIVIVLDRSNCVPVDIILNPEEQTPVDASSKQHS